MKSLNLLAMALVIIGGINWLLIGAGQFDLVASLFGGPDTGAARVLYVLVGLSAIWQLVPFFRALRRGEASDLREH